MPLGVIQSKDCTAPRARKKLSIAAASTVDLPRNSRDQTSGWVLMPKARRCSYPSPKETLRTLGLTVRDAPIEAIHVNVEVNVAMKNPSTDH